MTALVATAGTRVEDPRESHPLGAKARNAKPAFRLAGPSLPASLAVCVECHAKFTLRPGNVRAHITGPLALALVVTATAARELCRQLTMRSHTQNTSRYTRSSKDVLVGGE
ncbi:hypothetical protein MTO96_020565 [Rhipicephalus appendiculatus]